jgi:hypothetical protein
MAATFPARRPRFASGAPRFRAAASLIELLVVLFIMGVMLSLLLPALSGARARAQATACQNNVRQLSMALSRSIQVTKRFPLPNRWTVDCLRWMEEAPLYQVMKNNFNPDTEFPRPPLLRCPMQEDFPSRVPAVGFSHYVLVVDRPIRGRPEKVSWEIQDRELLSEEEQQQPWFIAPEISYFGRVSLFANKPGPHPPGLYMTKSGLYPR